MKKIFNISIIIFSLSLTTANCADSVHDTVVSLSQRTGELYSHTEFGTLYNATEDIRKFWRETKVIEGRIATPEEQELLIKSIVETETSRAYVDGYKGFNFLNDYAVPAVTGTLSTHYAYLGALVRATHLLAESPNLTSEDLRDPILAELNYLQRTQQPQDRWLACTYDTYFSTVDWKALVQPHQKLDQYKIRETLVARKTAEQKARTVYQLDNYDQLPAGEGYSFKKGQKYSLSMHYNSGAGNECSYAFAQGSYDRGRVGFFEKIKADMEFYLFRHKKTLVLKEKQKIIDDKLEEIVKKSSLVQTASKIKSNIATFETFFKSSIVSRSLLSIFERNLRDFINAIDIESKGKAEFDQFLLSKLRNLNLNDKIAQCKLYLDNVEKWKILNDTELTKKVKDNYPRQEVSSLIAAINSDDIKEEFIKTNEGKKIYKDIEKEAQEAISKKEEPLEFECVDSSKRYGFWPERVHPKTVKDLLRLLEKEKVQHAAADYDLFERFERVTAYTFEKSPTLGWKFGNAVPAARKNCSRARFTFGGATPGQPGHWQRYVLTDDSHNSLVSFIKCMTHQKGNSKWW